MKMISRTLAGLAMLCAGATFAPSPVIAQSVGSFQQTGAGAVLRSFVSKMRDRVDARDFGAVCDGTTNDTAAIVTALTAANGKTLYFNTGTCLTDPVVIAGASNNVPAQIIAHGTIFKQRSGTTPALKIENPQNATGFTSLIINGLSVDANSIGSNAVQVHGAQPLTAGFKSPIRLSDITIRNATGCGLNLLGEPGFGVYSVIVDSMHAPSNASGLCEQSINNTGGYYVQGNQIVNFFADGSTTQGVYIDYANNDHTGLRAEATTAGPGVSINHTLKSNFFGGHMENNLLAGIDTSFNGTAGASLGVRILGSRTTGLITGLNGGAGNVLAPGCGGFCQAGITDAGINSDYVQTQGIAFNAASYVNNGLSWPSVGHLAIGGSDSAQIVVNGISLPATKGIALAGLTPSADSINYSATNGLSFLKGGSTRAQIFDGWQIGAPTGGDKGSGTLNAASNLYVNNVLVALQNRLINTTSPIAGGGDLSADRTITCPTCATTTNGGAITGTSPVSVSAAGAISLTGSAGQIPNGATGAFTATPVIGTSVTVPLHIGGTGAASTLELRATSGAGAGSDLITFTGGNNGATEFMRLTDNPATGPRLGLNNAGAAATFDMVGASNDAFIDQYRASFVVRVQNGAGSAGMAFYNTGGANAGTQTVIQNVLNRTTGGATTASALVTTAKDIGNATFASDVQLQSSVAATLGTRLYITQTGGVAIASTAPTMALNEFGMTKIAASGSAPGAGFMKLAVQAGTNAGTCKLVAYAGTSGTAVTVIDNVGAGC